jgi:hypothetical protein
MFSFADTVQPIGQEHHYQGHMKALYKLKKVQHITRSK